MSNTYASELEWDGSHSIGQEIINVISEKYNFEVIDNENGMRIIISFENSTLEGLKGEIDLILELFSKFD